MIRPLHALDHWAARHPWQARLAPLAVWIVFLPLVRLTEAWAPQWLPAVYALQILPAGALLWRWRVRFDELTLRFHWLSCAAAVLVLALWLGLGWLCRGTLAQSWQAAQSGGVMPAPASALATLRLEHPTLGWTALLLRLFGMVLVVPMIEELFFRSALVRIFHSWPAVGRHLARFPLLEKWGGPSPLAQAPPPSLGVWIWPGVLISTLLFALNHQRGDWAGAFLTGLIWCGLTVVCNRPKPPGKPLGLGPAIWSHALVNAALWGWCVGRGDWGLL